MAEPTRWMYLPYNMASTTDGPFVEYSDYAALRAKAEAVVKEYHDYNFNKMVDRIAELKEHLK